MTNMNKMIVIGILGISALAILGIFVNPIFLYLSIFALCPLMHLFMGHGEHGKHTEHEHHEEQEKSPHKKHRRAKKVEGD